MNQCKRGNIINIRQTVVALCFIILLIATVSFASASDMSDNMTVSEVDDQDTIKATEIQKDALGEGQKSFEQLDEEIHDESVPEGGLIELNSSYTFSDTDNVSVGTDGIDITKDVTIDGKGYTLDASNKASIFKIANNAHVILKNIVFSNGNATNGGAIYVEAGSTIEVINCTFQNNFASNDGGAIYMADDSLTSTSTIYDSTFTLNIAANNGGAIYTASTLNVTLSDFSYNNASNSGGSMYVGGAVHISRSTFDHESAASGGAIDLYDEEDNHSTIENSSFTNCYSSGDGGAVYIRTDNVIVENVEFAHNTAGDDGGAIFWEGGNGRIYNITCSDNRGISKDKSDNETSSTRGGTICLTGSNVTISASSFTSSAAYIDEGKNSSKVDGGALFITGNDVTISDVTFSDCNAANEGGAVYLIGNNTRIIRCDFTDSTAKDGGALFVNGTHCELHDSTFTGNIAGDDGGAIFWEGNNGVIYNITCADNKGISYNESSSRGGTICLTGDNVTVNKSSFKSTSVSIAAGRDSSKIDGGALFITGNDIKIIETQFDDCKATNAGGAIYILGDNTHLINCNYTNTQALVGGAVYVAGDDTIIDDSLFRHNDAKGATQAEGGTGGAVYVDGHRSIISNSDFAYDTAVRYGGAISVWGTDAIITNNVFDYSSTTEFYGGAIFVNGFNATISLSNFTRCKAINDFARGGAIDIGGGNANISKCNFNDCYAYYGGDIYVNGANAIINGSNFEHGGIYNNKHSYQGGAIYVDGTNTVIAESNFTDFIAEDNGGAIFIQGENTLIMDSNFDDSEAKWGGDIYVFGNYARIEGSTFSSSNADYGGAIYLNAWGAVIKDSNISTCVASSSGGAIYVAGGGTNIVGSSFEECKATQNVNSAGGGAIYITGPDTHISESDFNGNWVTGSKARGGTIYINGERTIIDGSCFNDSYAGEGGIIYIQGEYALVDSSTFANSSSSDYGGAISVHGDNATIRWSDFENVKTTSSSGGAIYVDGKGTNILYSSFDNTVAKSNGGSIYISDIGTTVAYSNFTHARANTGGAITIDGVNTIISYCNINNNTATSAGAIKVSGSDSYISNCNISYNSATSGSGGALDIGGERASVLYSYFSFNTATGTGGAINWQGGHGNDSIIGTTFVNNSCTGQPGGGAIFWTQGNSMASGGLIRDCIFINNSAYTKHGGALNWYRTMDSTIDNCLFINNYASSDGGALYTGDQGGNSFNLTFINCQFYNNTAAKHGGAIANQMGKSYIYNITFDGNKAGYSGGSILMKEGPARDTIIDHCYIYNSYCTQKNDEYGHGGGAIHIGDDNITISNSAIINSTSDLTFGGAISFEAFKDKMGKWHYARYASLINVTIQNVATNNANGGAIYWSGDYGYMYNVTIFNASSNSKYGSEANGGAIYISGSNGNFNNIAIASSSSNNNNPANSNTANGGAIYVSGKTNAFTNVTIDDSQASSVRMDANGGAIYWSGSSGSLINASISNTLANGKGGAIYWSGSAKTFENVSIEYSQTNVTSSTTIENNGCGGAIYTTTIDELKNVYIVDALASTESGDIKGGAIYFAGSKLNNVTVIGSRAVTGDGASYGGAVYLQAGSTTDIRDSMFRVNSADFGGAVFSDRKINVYTTLFIGNVALDGGAIYVQTGDISLTDSTFELNSAKRGGAVFTDDVLLKIDGSALRNNTAEEKGGAIYHNLINEAGTTYIRNSDVVNNTAFQGSAIYTTKFFELTNVVLLDNQANSKEFIEKHVGVDETGKNYTSAVFVGFDNLLNAIWLVENVDRVCNNVTYWGVNGITVSNSRPNKSDREVWQNVTVEMFNSNGEKINEAVVVTDADGRCTYYFDAEDNEDYYFAFTHETDRYYTYLRDTLSNRSLVKIYAYTPIFYGQNQTILISLTDGAWGDLNGTVTVTVKGPFNATFEVEVVNGTYTRSNISGLPIGKYNVTATFDGDLDHTGDSDWVIFEVLPYDDLHITKWVNITADFVNVSDIIKYVINVTNHGPSDGRGVNVTEILSPYLKLIRSETTRGYYNYTNGTWYIGDLEVNETVTLTIIAKIIHMGPITNTVWVTGEGRDINITNDMDSAHNFTALPLTDLRIIKEVNVTKDIVNVLDVIKFTITVFNDGPSDATGVFVSEPLDFNLQLISSEATMGRYEGDTWNIGVLPNGTNATLTIVAQVVYSGNFSNAVHVNGYENETNYTNNYASIKNFTAIANVDVGIIKTVNVTGYVNVTDYIQFNITVYNNGPCNATGVYVSEIIDYTHLEIISNSTSKGEYDGATWIINTLNKGEVVNLTIIAKVINVGTFGNVVSVASSDNDTDLSNNNASIDNITALPIVDLEIIKVVTEGGKVVNVSDEIEFTITVKNNGPWDATNVTVVEVLSPHLQMTYNHTWIGEYDVNTGIWYIGNLTRGYDVALVIRAKVISNGTISNVVVVTSTENDTNMSNNNDTIDNITALPVVDLAIVKDVNVTVANVTDKVKFTISVTNNGPSNATHVNVSEILNHNLRLISNVTEYGYYDAAKGIWFIGNLENGTTAVLTLVCEIVGNGTIVNYVNVTSYENDTNIDNNEYSIAFIANPIVDVSITKSININTTVVNIGQQIQFTVTIHNDGPSNATGVWVSEILDYNHLKLISNTTTKGRYDGFSWVIEDLNNGSTETLTLVCEVTAPGNFSNFVEVKSNEADTNLTNNKDNITNITSLYLVDLDITKTAEIWGGASIAQVGDFIQFTINVYNHGPCDATNVTVSEVLSPHLRMTGNSTWAGYYNVTEGIWHIGDLANGGFAQLIIVAQVISEGNISNFVSVRGNENDTNMSNNNFTIKNITAVPVVDLKIVKDLNVSVVSIGDRIRFNITVYNNGPCNATEVNVTEIIDSHLKLIANSTDTGYYNMTGGYWYIGDLNVGSNATMIIVCELMGDGIVPNYVNVSSYENETYPYDNWDIVHVSTTPIVDVSITKEVNVESDVVSVGQLIEFTVTVHNDGPSDATGVYVGEIINHPLSLISNTTSKGTYKDGTWNIGDLPYNATETLKLVCMVMYAGNISNSVNVVSTENDTNMSNNRDNLNLTAVVNVDVGIIKTVNVTGVVNVTDYVMFNITVYNNGLYDATGVAVIEALDYYHLELISNSTSKGKYDGYSWDIGNLAKGETVNMTIVVRVKAPGSFGNEVSVSSYENDTNMSNNNDSIKNITALPVVDLEITKEVTKGGSIVNVSDEIEFTIKVRNNGPCDATNVTVVEILSPHLEMTGNSTWKNYYNVTTGIWNVGTLVKGEWATLTIRARVISNGTISNFVTISSNENDTNKSNNNDTIDNITALPVVDLNVTKAVNVTAANVGDFVMFTINVTNRGPSNATDVVAYDKLSGLLKFIKFIPSRDDISYDETTGKITIGRLNVNETVSLMIIAKVIGNGTIPNLVNVTSHENDTNNTNNNGSSDNVTATPVVDLNVTKVVNVTAANVGDYISYTINVTNRGPSNATEVVAYDKLSGLLEFIKFIPSRDDISYDETTGKINIGALKVNETVSLMIIARVIGNGTIPNVVNVTSHENDTNNTNNNGSSDNVTATPVVDLNVTKVANVTVAYIGDYISYTINVANCGPSNATDVVAYDKLSGLLEFTKFIPSREDVGYDDTTGKIIIGTLKVNETVTLIIIAKVIGNGTIPNAINVTSHENDTNNTNNNGSSDNVTALPVVDLNVTKVANVTVAYIGDYISYTINVANRGPSNATEVVANDKLSGLLEFIRFTPSRDDISYDETTGKINIGALKVNETVTLIIIAKVIGNGTIPNVVNVTSHENDTNKTNNNGSSQNVTGLPVTNLTVVKYSNVTGTVNVNDLVKFTINVTNHGPSNATMVVITDELVDAFGFVNATGNWKRDGQKVIWTIPRLNNGTTVSVDLTVRVLRNGTLENVAFAKSNENKTGTTNGTNITANPIVDVAINKTVDKTKALVGDNVKYTIYVVNNGPSDATDVYVTDKLHQFLYFISFESNRTGITYDKDTGIARIGSLKANETVILYITAKVIELGEIPNVVNVTSHENDTNSSNNNYTSENVTADSRLTPIDLDAYDIYYGDDEVLTVTLPRGATGTVNITVNGIPHNNIPINSGIAVLPLYDLGGGDYNVYVAYGGNGDYVANSTSGKFKVLPLTPTIRIEVVDIWHGEVEVLNVTVNAPGTVNITVNGRTITIPLDHQVRTTNVLMSPQDKLSYDGKATWILIGLPVGTYPAYAVYNGNENYTTVSTSDVFHVRDKPSTVVVTADDIHVGEDAVINVQVGPKGVTGNVTLVVEGKTYELNIDENGRASITVPGLKAGLKHVYVKYNGDILYRVSENTTTFKVLKHKPPIDVVAPDIKVGEDGKITVTVPKDAKGTVTIKVNGKTYTKPVRNGKAVFIIPGLKAGTHSIRAYYSGDDRYLSASAVGKIKVASDGEKDTIKHNAKSAEGTLQKHATGNPIFMLIVIILALCTIPLRRFRK